MFFLYGTAISPADARYLLTALGAIGSPVAIDAAEMIARGITGRRNTVPLSPAMQEAVCAALEGDPPVALQELREKVMRRTLLVKDW